MELEFSPFECVGSLWVLRHYPLSPNMYMHSCFPCVSVLACDGLVTFSWCTCLLPIDHWNWHQQIHPCQPSGSRKKKKSYFKLLVSEENNQIILHAAHVKQKYFIIMWKLLQLHIISIDAPNVVFFTKETNCLL